MNPTDVRTERSFSFVFVIVHVRRSLFVSRGPWRERIARLGRVRDGRPDDARPMHIHNLHRKAINSGCPVIGRLTFTVDYYGHLHKRVDGTYDNVPRTHV